MTDETNTDPGTTGATPAQKNFAAGRWCFDQEITKTEKIESLYGLTASALERAEEVADDVERLTELFQLLSDQLDQTNERVEVIEAARVTPAEARESEPECAECGHVCSGYRPAAPPVPTVALDPVLVEAVADWFYTFSGETWERDTCLVCARGVCAAIAKVPR